MHYAWAMHWILSHRRYTPGGTPSLSPQDLILVMILWGSSPPAQQSAPAELHPDLQKYYTTDCGDHHLA
eukprot:m.208397 g.208397  ORF g.208397 m.208397 type:complete len:69 (+) comp25416_c1_seq28:57-263(+)